MSSDYPSSVSEVLDDNMKFPRGVIAAAKRYAKSRPWTGSKKERACKLERFYAEICAAYGVIPPLLDTIVRSEEMATQMSSDLEIFFLYLVFGVPMH